MLQNVIFSSLVSRKCYTKLKEKEDTSLLNGRLKKDTIRHVKKIKF